MKLNSTKSILTLGFSITAIATTVVAVPVALSRYQQSYSDQFNSNQDLSKAKQLETKFSFDQSKFDEAVAQIKVKDNFKDVSAKTIYNLTNDPLYSFKLYDALDLTSLTKDGIQIEIDTTNARVEGGQLTNVTIRGYDKENNLTFSKTISIAGFATSDSIDDNLTNVSVDPSKSNISINSQKLILPSEFALSLEDSFQQLNKDKSVSQAFIEALLANKASIGLYNGFGKPAFFANRQIISPQTNINEAAQKQRIVDNTNASSQQLNQAFAIYNLVYSNINDEQGTLTIGIEIKQGEQIQKIDLNVQGLAKTSDIEQAISTELTKNISQYVNINQSELAKIVASGANISDLLYNKDNNNTSEFVQDLQKQFYKNNVVDVLLDPFATAEEIERAKQLDSNPESIEQIVKNTFINGDYVTLSDNTSNDQTISFDNLQIGDYQVSFNDVKLVVPTQDASLSSQELEQLVKNGQLKLKFSLTINKKLNVNSPYLQNIATSNYLVINEQTLDNTGNNSTTRNIGLQFNFDNITAIANVSKVIYENAFATQFKDVKINQYINRNFFVSLGSDKYEPLVNYSDVKEALNTLIDSLKSSKADSTRTFDDVKKAVAAITLLNSGAKVSETKLIALTNELIKNNSELLSQTKPTEAPAEVQPPTGAQTQQAAGSNQTANSGTTGTVTPSNTTSTTTPSSTTPAPAANLYAKYLFVKADDQKTGDNFWKWLYEVANPSIKEAEVDFEIEESGYNRLTVIASWKQSGQTMLTSRFTIINITPDNGAFKIAQKYNPDVFIDARNAIDSTSGNSRQIRDSIRGDIGFKLANFNNQSAQGLLLQKAVDITSLDSLPQKNKMPGNQTTQKDVTKVNSGVIYLAFETSEIKNNDKYYLLRSDDNKKGIFIQKAKKSVNSSNINAFIIGIDDLNGGNDNPVLLIDVPESAAISENKLNKVTVNSSNTVQTEELQNTESDKNLFRQFKTGDTTSIIRPLVANSTILLTIATTPGFIRVTAQSSASANVSRDKLDAYTFIQDSTSKTKFDESGINWNKIGFDKTDQASLVVKALAIFKGEELINQNFYKLNEVRQGFVDTYLKDKK
ncbi:P110/LppT family adhesin N-terminal domain [Mesomycoplasma conjunctivae]|uniref:P110/LppT family adhesin N-terminal domain n=1 Tax=Mesomycoplasma conjunctivae TaxID=45361 RepID=UPI003DA46B38